MESENNTNQVTVNHDTNSVSATTSDTCRNWETFWRQVRVYYVKYDKDTILESQEIISKWMTYQMNNSTELYVWNGRPITECTLNEVLRPFLSTPVGVNFMGKDMQKNFKGESSNDNVPPVSYIALKNALIDVCKAINPKFVVSGNTQIINNEYVVLVSDYPVCAGGRYYFADKSTRLVPRVNDLFTNALLDTVRDYKDVDEYQEDLGQAFASVIRG